MADMAAPTDGTRGQDLRILVVGPDIQGVSGEPTHIRTLLSSPLAEEFELLYHRVGGGERRLVPENPIRRNLARILSPFGFLLKLLFSRVHIVHINNTFNTKGLIRDCTLAALAALMRKKVVFEMHGGQPQKWFETHGLLRPFVLWSLRRVHRVICLSREQERFLAQHLDSQRYTLIPNMVEVQRFKPSVPQKPPAFLYVGRLLRTKGVFDLVEAFSRLERGPVLWIAGDGPARPELQRMINQKSLGHRARLLGFVIGQDKIQLFSKAWALILPSYHEGFPYTVLEAMASALPVVATRVGAIPEMIQHGTEGLLLPPGRPDLLARAMQSLLDPDLRNRMAKASLDAVQRYSVDKVFRQYSRVYREI